MGSNSSKKRATKREHRQSSLPEGHAGRILDRLLLLEQVIPPGDVLQVLRDTGCLDARRCTLTFLVTCWLVLAMGLLTELPIRQVFKAARRLMPADWDPDRSTLCKARQRLGVAPLRLLFERLARPLADLATPGAFYKAWRLVAMDGCVYNVPDWAANASAFGYPKGGRGSGAFPQVRKLSLVEVGTHAELALVVKGIKQKQSGEQSMAPGLFRHLTPGMLLLWDRGFFSYKLWQELILRSCQVLARVKAGLVLRSIQELPDGSHLARIYPCYSMRNKDRCGIVVRVIRYTHDDPRRVGCGLEHVLLTTLLDALAHPARELILLYHQRWEIELTFDEQKTHQNPWRVTKPADLRSQTPLGVLQEMYALSIGHYVMRGLMASAAQTEGLDPDRLSFVGCLQVLRTRLPEFPAQVAAQAGWLQALLTEMARERTPPRRNRVNPRVVRVKMSKFKKKRPEHRGGGKLDRPFGEIIIPRPASQLATG
jgi:Insertion element 4 transposase N-terminal/Transposase DDE domain